MQLSGAPDLRIKACVYDLDGFDTSKSTVARLHRRHVRVICHIAAGVWEGSRPDAGEFPRAVIGRIYKDRPDQRWLDVSRFSLFTRMLTQRIGMCAHKGFDAVEPDNVDGWERRSRTGFTITRANQIRFNRWLAWQVHIRGMAIALKNDGRQAQRLRNNFDFAIAEQCFRRRECGDYEDAFIRHHKAVFEVEYEQKPRQYCRTAKAIDFSSIGKSYDLLAKPWTPCVR